MRVHVEGVCSVCEETVRLRKNGTTYAHPIPVDINMPLVGTITDQGIVWEENCAGGGQHPTVILEMTFARWLHAHVARRDARTNPVTYLAQRAFRPCSRTRKTLVDIVWASPDELHLLLHGTSDKCGWQCRYVKQAASEWTLSPFSLRS
jgi:hypothetical protein